MSKFGAHVSTGGRRGFGTALKQCFDAGSPVPVLCALDQDLWPDVYNFSPSTVLIFRTQPRGYDNPQMYDGDPAEAAYIWYSRCKTKWLLNRAHYYAPSNERNPNPGEKQNKWLDEFDLELMKLADIDGFKLALHGDSFGTPEYSDWKYYQKSLDYAAEHGHILILHEYGGDSTMCNAGGDLVLRYRKVHNLINPAVKITITEASGGNGYSGEAGWFDDMVWYDEQTMQDDYLIGFCAYQLGGAENWTALIPKWADYVSTHPTSTPIKEPTTSFVFGLHCTSSPGPMQPGDSAAITAAAKFNGYKFLTGDPPEHYAQIFALGIQPANCITRLFQKFNGDEPKPTAAQFCEWQNLAINEAISAGVTWFELHNEPNLSKSYGDVAEWPYSDDPHDFISWALEVIPMLRAQHPGIKLVSPGLSPQSNTPAWWNEFVEHGLFSACDAIGAHVYWPDRATMLTPEQGLNFTPLLNVSSVTKPIFITEYCNNLGNDTDYEKGVQYCDWAAYVQSNYSTVARVYLYIVSSQTAVENDKRQTLVRNGVVTQIVNGIKDGTIQPLDWQEQQREAIQLSLLKLETVQNHVNELRDILLGMARSIKA